MSSPESAAKLCKIPSTGNYNVDYDLQIENTINSYRRDITGGAPIRLPRSSSPVDGLVAPHYRQLLSCYYFCYALASLKLENSFTAIHMAQAVEITDRSEKSLLERSSPQRLGNAVKRS